MALDLEAHIAAARARSGAELGTDIGRLFELRCRRWSVRPTDARAVGERRLRALLGHARRNVCAYRQIGAAAVNNPRADKLLADFPIITKTALRDRMADFIADMRRVGRTALTRTGGSTGEPAVHLKSWTDEQAAGKALERRLLLELGLEPRDEILDLAPRLVSPNRDARLLDALCSEELDQVLRWRLLSFRRRPDVRPVEEYCATLARTIAFIDGAPSRIETLADFCEQSGYRLAPKSVISSYEQLSPSQRKRFEETFNCRVVSLYGTTETGISAWECLAGRFHFEQDFAWPEILRLDDDDPVKAGETGRIVITSLSSWLMPVIRYETGDLGALATDKCSCGREGPALEALEGRLGVSFQDAGGTLVRPFFLMNRLDLTGLRQYQIIQLRPGVLEINVGSSDASDALLENVRAELQSAGPRFEISFVRQRPFQLTLSGKRNPFVIMDS